MIVAWCRSQWEAVEGGCGGTERGGPEHLEPDAGQDTGCGPDMPLCMILPVITREQWDDVVGKSGSCDELDVYVFRSSISQRTP